MQVEDVPAASTGFSLDVDAVAEGGWLPHLEARNFSPETRRAYRLAAIELARFLRVKGMPIDVQAQSATPRRAPSARGQVPRR
jgi:hypothetical protein